MSDKRNTVLVNVLNDQIHDGHIKVLGYYESIGHGTTNGDIIPERCMGRRTGIGTTAYKILEEFDFVQPSTDTQMYIQSSSAEDAAAGTGIQQITIKYFSAAWGDIKSTIVTTNGTNQVALSVADVFRIHTMVANRAGTAGVAVGNITLTNQAADVLYGEISATNAFMQRCIFYVGNGKKVTCTEGLFSSSTASGIIGRVFATEEDASGNLVSRARILFEVADNTIAYVFGVPETVSNPNNKRIAIGIAVKGVTANQSASATLKGFNETI